MKVKLLYAKIKLCKSKEGAQVDSKDTIRRDKGMLFLTDEVLAEQLNDARRLIQRINFMGRSDGKPLAAAFRTSP